MAKKKGETPSAVENEQSDGPEEEAAPPTPENTGKFAPGWYVKLDGKIEGSAHPFEMAAIRAADELVRKARAYGRIIEPVVVEVK